VKLTCQIYLAEWRFAKRDVFAHSENGNPTGE
jgi:hypothetical protein